MLVKISLTLVLSFCAFSFPFLATSLSTIVLPSLLNSLPRYAVFFC